ncbi:MAG: carboxypeptidase regulatory-like domain-containing protein [Longimicrobiales bacterium]
MTLAGARAYVTVALLATTTPATAQSLVGRALDAQTEAPIAGVAIALLDTLGTELSTTVSDSAGEFLLTARDAGVYTLRAERLGYETVHTRPLEIGSGERVSVVLRLGVRAVELSPLTVTARRAETLRERDLREYYERIERHRRLNIGRIYTRSDLERLSGWTLRDAITRLALPTRRCTPVVFLDGREVPPAVLDPGRSIVNVEAIEFYSGHGPASIRFSDPRGCGLVLVWSRPMQDNARPFRLRTLLRALGALVVLTLLGSLIT